MFEFSLGMKGGWVISDHHVIKVMMSYTPATSVEVDVKCWRTSVIKWVTYGVLIREVVTVLPLGDFQRKPLHEQVVHATEFARSTTCSLRDVARQIKEEWSSGHVVCPRKETLSAALEGSSCGRENLMRWTRFTQESNWGKASMTTKRILIETKEGDCENVSRNCEDP